MLLTARYTSTLLSILLSHVHGRRPGHPRCCRWVHPLRRPNHVAPQPDRGTTQLAPRRYPVPPIRPSAQHTTTYHTIPPTSSQPNPPKPTLPSCSRGCSPFPPLQILLSFPATPDTAQFFRHSRYCSLFPPLQILLSWDKKATMAGMVNNFKTDLGRVSAIKSPSPNQQYLVLSLPVLHTILRRPHKSSASLLEPLPLPYHTIPYHTIPYQYPYPYQY